MLGKAIAIGAAGAVGVYLIWKLAPGLSRAAEPTLRAAIKANVKAVQKAREAYAHMTEVAEDAYAEAWSDLNREAAAEEMKAGEPQPG
jgi:predicted transcriptional regulator